MWPRQPRFDSWSGQYLAPVSSTSSHLWTAAGEGSCAGATHCLLRVRAAGHVRDSAESCAEMARATRENKQHARWNSPCWNALLVPPGSSAPSGANLETKKNMTVCLGVPPATLAERATGSKLGSCSLRSVPGRPPARRAMVSRACPHELDLHGCGMQTDTPASGYCCDFRALCDIRARRGPFWQAWTQCLATMRDTCTWIREPVTSSSAVSMLRKRPGGPGAAYRISMATSRRRLT